MSCTCFTRGVVRKSRAHYRCATCNGDVSMKIILLAGVVPESELPPLVKAPPPQDAAIRKPLTASGIKCCGFNHPDFLH